MIINCKKYAEEWLDETRKRVERFPRQPRLTVEYDPNAPDQVSYLKSIENACKRVGIACDAVNTEEWTDEHLGSYYMSLLPGANDTHTAEGIVYLLDKLGGVSGKHVCVINRSERIGRPLAKMLLDRDATVTVCHSKTNERDLMDSIANKEIIVTAIGAENKALNCAWRYSPLIVDAGFRVEDGKPCGDTPQALFDLIANGYGDSDITPVPGGVGLLTTAALMASVADAAEGRTHEKD